VVEPGDTEMVEVLEATNVPPQLPLYQYQPAPVPKLPPETVSVVLLPLQMVVVPVMAVGATDDVKGDAVTFNCKLPVEVELK
jgi:hypothetical protein